MISIVTPTFNRAHLLPRMIESILHQTFKDWELIIMDDGSTDTTQEVIAGYKDNRIKFFENENSGAADKRNRGVEKSKGEYVVFLDSDDEVKENWLKEFNRCLEDERAEIACCGMEKYNSKGELILTKLPFKYSALYGGVEGYFLAGTFIIKKTIFQAIGGYDVKLRSGHHTDFLLRLTKFFKGRRISIVNIMKPLVKIHVHEGMKIRSDHKAVLFGTLDLIEKHEEIFAKNRNDYQDYLSVAAVNAFRAGENTLGKKLIFKAYKLNPLQIKNLLRLVAANFSLLRRRVWEI